MSQATTELAPEAIELFNAMATALKGKPKKAKAKKPKFVMIVNGNVMSQLVPTKKDAIKAARTIILSAIARGDKEPTVEIASINEALTIDVPVASAEINGSEVEA